MDDDDGFVAAEGLGVRRRDGSRGPRVGGIGPVGQGTLDEITVFEVGGHHADLEAAAARVFGSVVVAGAPREMPVVFQDVEHSLEQLQKVRASIDLSQYRDQGVWGIGVNEPESRVVVMDDGSPSALAVEQVLSTRYGPDVIAFSHGPAPSTLVRRPPA